MVYENDVQRTKVVIVGAGPTGLVLAIELARRGVGFRLIDAAAGPFTGSRGKGIQPRTLEIFDLLGVIDDVLAAGALYPSMRVHLGPLSFTAGSLGSRHAPSPGTPYPNLWMVPQFKTEGILRKRLEALGGRAEFGARFESLAQSAGGVQVTLANGERIEAEYVVGCDGGRSAVRKALGLKLVGEAIDDKTMTVADLEIPALDRGAWHAWPLKKVSACPLPGTALFQVTAPVMDEATLRRTVERLSKCSVARVAWQSEYRPAVRMVEQYRVGRVFLAGDAAHVHPPDGGQGLNTGVQDAWNLGWKLAEVIGGAGAELLETYEEERLPIAASVLALSKTLRVKKSFKRGALTNQLGVHYRGSSLSKGAAVGAVHPGDRVADAEALGLLREGRRVEWKRADGVVLRLRPDGYVESLVFPSP